jgi:hypothetical protein
LSNDILDVNKKSWKELQDMIDDDDLYNEAGDSYGRKMTTLLYYMDFMMILKIKI